MAFGLKKEQLLEWKKKIDNGEIAFITHYWYDERFPDAKTVTKVGCNNMDRLAQWGKQYGLKKEWIHNRKDGYSHFDLIGPHEKRILQEEGLLTNHPLLNKKKKSETAK